jgi:hypothetical protein
MQKTSSGTQGALVLRGTIYGYQRSSNLCVGSQQKEANISVPGIVANLSCLRKRLAFAGKV